MIGGGDRSLILVRTLCRIFIFLEMYFNCIGRVHMNPLGYRRNPGKYVHVFWVLSVGLWIVQTSKTHKGVSLGLWSWAHGPMLAGRGPNLGASPVWPALYCSESPFAGKVINHVYLPILTSSVLHLTEGSSINDFDIIYWNLSKIVLFSKYCMYVLENFENKGL